MCEFGAKSGMFLRNSGQILRFAQEDSTRFAVF
jgi:hypothetical protein